MALFCVGAQVIPLKSRNAPDVAKVVAVTLIVALNAAPSVIFIRLLFPAEEEPPTVA